MAARQRRVMAIAQTRDVGARSVLWVARARRGSRAAPRHL